MSGKKETKKGVRRSIDSILKERDFFSKQVNAPEVKKVDTISRPPEKNVKKTDGDSAAALKEIKDKLGVETRERKSAEVHSGKIINISYGKESKSASKVKLTRRYSDKKSISAKMMYLIISAAALVLSFGYYLLTSNLFRALLIFFGMLILIIFSSIAKKRLEYYGEIKKMESVFPDFISLMSSNLRAGMTIDRALLLSSRKEFSPLDKEILQVGKDILTSKEISAALSDMAKRINSEEITKTVQLIISGIRSGGDLSVLLEETANNMRERIFVKKRASSNVLMYVIFIFFAVAVGAPLLFGLSSVLVELMTNIFSGVSVENVNLNLPFTLTQISVSTSFIFYFSILFMVTSSVMASMVLGLVSSGKERDGLKYILILIVSSITVFLVSRFFLLKYFSGVAK